MKNIRKLQKNDRKTKEHPRKTMKSKEQQMKVIKNQRKIKGTKTMRTIEKPMNNQRRNNEKQWRTSDNFASILNYFWPGTLCPCFFEFSIFNGERNKRQF